MRPLFLLLLIIGSTPAFCDIVAKSTHGQDRADATEGVDFDDEKNFIDVEEALGSKEYVHRSILSTVISDTVKLHLGRFYVNHLLGFNAIYHNGNGKTINWIKYTSGMMGLAGGYAFKQGHALELGLEFSTISTGYLGYRYFFSSENFALWPFVGAGVGRQISGLEIADGPPEEVIYLGEKTMYFANVGIFVPLVDIGIKGEVRLAAFGTDRFILTTGLGAILFF